MYYLNKFRWRHFDSHAHSVSVRLNSLLLEKQVQIQSLKKKQNTTATDTTTTTTTTIIIDTTDTARAATTATATTTTIIDTTHEEQQNDDAIKILVKEYVSNAKSKLSKSQMKLVDACIPHLTCAQLKQFSSVPVGLSVSETIDYILRKEAVVKKIESEKRIEPESRPQRSCNSSMESEDLSAYDDVFKIAISAIKNFTGIEKFKLKDNKGGGNCFWYTLSYHILGSADHYLMIKSRILDFLLLEEDSWIDLFGSEKRQLYETFMYAWKETNDTKTTNNTNTNLMEINGDIKINKKGKQYQAKSKDGNIVLLNAMLKNLTEKNAFATNYDTYIIICKLIWPEFSIFFFQYLNCKHEICLELASSFQALLFNLIDAKTEDAAMMTRLFNLYEFLDSMNIISGKDVKTYELYEGEKSAHQNETQDEITTLRLRYDKCILIFHHNDDDDDAYSGHYFTGVY